MSDYCTKIFVTDGNDTDNIFVYKYDGTPSVENLLDIFVDKLCNKNCNIEINFYSDDKFCKHLNTYSNINTYKKIKNFVKEDIINAYHTMSNIHRHALHDNIVSYMEKCNSLIDSLDGSQSKNNVKIKKDIVHYKQLINYCKQDTWNNCYSYEKYRVHENSYKDQYLFSLSKTNTLDRSVLGKFGYLNSNTSEESIYFALNYFGYRLNGYYVTANAIVEDFVCNTNHFCFKLHDGNLYKELYVNIPTLQYYHFPIEIIKKDLKESLKIINSSSYYNYKLDDEFYVRCYDGSKFNTESHGLISEIEEGDINWFDPYIEMIDYDFSKRTLNRILTRTFTYNSDEIIANMKTKMKTIINDICTSSEILDKEFFNKLKVD